MTVTPLGADALRRRCDLQHLPFETTEELEPLAETTGQDRAVEAVRFGVGIPHEGYNLFVMGSPETGRRFVVRSFLEQRAAEDGTPEDIVYVNNFETPHRPRLLLLPAGTGKRLEKDVTLLVEEFRAAIPAAFEGEHYRPRKEAVEKELHERQEAAFNPLREDAERRRFTLLQTPAGFTFAPIDDEGKPIPSEELEGLSAEERKRISESFQELASGLRHTLENIQGMQKEAYEKIRQLDQDVTRETVTGLIRDLHNRYAPLPEVVEYLNTLAADVIENAQLFLKGQEEQQNPLVGALQGGMDRSPFSSRDPFRRYAVNVLLEYGDNHGAPVIYEDNPTYPNLVGRIEHLAQFGALTTDFTLIKPGALHRANGGYLILDVHKLLTQPYAWEGLKRALTAQEIRTESLAQALSMMSTVTLEPETVPLNLKVVLVGERMLYYLLGQYDPEFSRLFKVAADFDESFLRDAVNDEQYARLIGTLVRREGLHPFSRSGVERIIEQSSRFAGDSERVSAHTARISDLLREADYWAANASSELVRGEDVQRAIDVQHYQKGRMRDRMLEEIDRGTLLIDTRGETIGQVNGLSVASWGDYAFGHPIRITARVRLGKGEVVDIEREVALGGPIHAKGVLILTGFLGARYAVNDPLSLSATLVFEQSYGMVEGDSASSAELYALLSSLAQLPIRQSFAVTGSVNQLGHVQPIGGVNEKIEGFFDVCKMRELTGDQGIVIPASNVKHLMLRPDVVKAVESGTFHIYPVETVDQGIEVLTGVEAGEADRFGMYPEDSVNGRVEARLVSMAHRRMQLSRMAREDAGEEGERPQ